MEEKVSVEYKNKIIYFCTEDCLDEFNDDPEQFLDSSHFELDFDMLDDAEKNSIHP